MAQDLNPLVCFLAPGPPAYFGGTHWLFGSAHFAAIPH